MLGNRLKSFGLNKGEVFSRTAFGILGIALALFVIGGTLIYGWRFDLVGTLGTILLFFVGLMGVWQIYSAVEALWKMPHIDVHEHGVRVAGRGSEQEWLWDDIQYIKGNITRHRMYGLPMYTSGAYKFSNDYMELFKLDNRVARLPELYSLIAAQVNGQRLPEYRQRLQQGETLDFGEVKISTQGVSKGKQQMVLSDLTGSSMNNGTLWIHGRGKPSRIAVMIETVVNPSLLVQLLREVASRNGAGR
ncbi:MAG: DUF6585 family protein [Anaerolineae bacterium]